jgi:hypothetical protein
MAACWWGLPVGDRAATRCESNGISYGHNMLMCPADLLEEACHDVAPVSRWVGAILGWDARQASPLKLRTCMICHRLYYFAVYLPGRKLQRA